MRTITAPERATIGGQSIEYHLRVEIQNESGTWVNYSDDPVGGLHELQASLDRLRGLQVQGHGAAAAAGDVNKIGQAHGRPKRIRKKFEAVDPQFDRIDTVYGMGYRWTG